MKPNTHMLRRLLASLSLLIGANANADNFSTGSPIPGAYDSPGDAIGRQQTNTEGLAESIDPFSGHLHVEHVDADIPGNGGLDLKVIRNYDGLQTAAGALGVGWDVNFGRILFPAAGGMCVALTNGSDIPLTSSGDVVFQSPDGGRRVLYVAKDGAGNYLNYLYESADGWKGTCVPANGTGNTGYGLLVTSPDGTQYYMTQRPGPSDAPGLLTDHIVDRNGNNIQFNFNTTLDQYHVYVSGAQTSDGRCLSLDYSTFGSSHLLTSITPGCGTITPSTTISLWYTNYAGVGYLLSSATRPDGLKWQYQYYASTSSSPNALHYLTYPNGGKVTYTYKSVNFGYQNPNITVSQKTVSGTGLTTANWYYTYTPGNPYDTTLVTGPTSCYVYQHESVKAAASNVSNIWQVGQLLYKEIDAISGSNCGAKLQSETFTWEKTAPPTYNLLTTQAQSLPGANPNAQPAFNVGPGYTIINGAPVGPDTSGIWTPRLTSHVIARYDASGGTTNYTTTYTNYDDFDNAQTVTETGPAGTRTTTYSYLDDADLWVLHAIQSQTIAGIGTISYTFDGNDNILTETRYGVLTTYTYTPQGDIATVVNARGYTNTYSNYKCGIAQTTNLQTDWQDPLHPLDRPVPAINNTPVGYNTYKTVDDIGRVISTKDGNTNVTGYGYDGLNRVKTITPPIHAATSITYNQNSTVLTRGTFTQTTTLDGLGRTTNVNNDGISTSFQLDALGRRTFESYPCYGNSCSTGRIYTLDALSRTLQVNNNGDSRYFSYLSNGTVNVTTENTYPLTYTYTAYGNPDARMLVELQTPTTDTTANYNAIGLINWVKQNGQTRSYGYNASWFLTSSTDPETGDTILGRDAIGNLSSVKVGGGEVDYVYDGQNRKVQIYPVTPATGQVNAAPTYIYFDNDNNVTFMDVGFNNPIIYKYDALDELTEEDHGCSGQQLPFQYVMVSCTNGAYLVVSYGHDDLDHLSSITYPSGRIVNYTPDDLGRPTTAGSYITKATYYPNGAVTTLNWGNGTAETQTLTSRNRVWTLNAAAGGGELASFTYGYDNDDNVTSITDAFYSSNNLTMTYDGDDQLSTASGSFGSGGATIDAGGNIRVLNLGTGHAYRFGYSNNRLTTVTGSHSYTVTYDGAANATYDGAFTYQYNNLNQIVSASSGTATALNYVYDGNGFPWVRKPAGGNGTYLLYSKSGLLLGEYTPTSSMLRENVYLGQSMVAYENAGASGTNCTPPGNTTPTYVVNDPQGSAVGASDYCGNVLWKQAYYPFGARSTIAATGQNDQWFTGKLQDDLTQLVDMGARQYNPTFGRFLSLDPQPVVPANHFSFNRYAYANNNPYRYADPNGQSPLEIAFLVADTVSLATAISSGEGVGLAVANELIDVVGVASPVPGISEAAHGLEAASKVAHVAEDAEKAAKEVEEGVVYLRTNPATGERYVGQAKSAERFEARQGEHDAALGVEHNYKVLGNAKPGKDLDVLEETEIRQNGGLQREGGTLANKRHQMSENRYRDAGGQTDNPTQ